MSTAHGLLKLSREAPEAMVDGKLLQFLFVKRKQNLIFLPECTENYDTFLFQLQIAFVLEAKLTKLLDLNLKVCRQLLAYLTGKKEKKIKWFKKKCHDNS